jgi:hypothetical protein
MASARKTPAGIPGLIMLLGAKPPEGDTALALRAWARGHATEVQQRLAFAYVAGELCGVGRSPFTGDSDGTAFRGGAHAVGIALAALTGAHVLSVPGERSPPVHEA